MNRLYIASLTLITSLLFVLAACSGNEPPPSVTIDSPAPAELKSFDPNNFDQSTQITNEWMPMKPGMHFVYDGTTVEDDGTVVPHRIEVTITDLSKMIGGVRALASWDLDFKDGELVEAELAFYAQDKTGNVWRMGEYPEEYEDGNLIGNPTWFHGIQNALAGIHMQAAPKEGTPSYAQGWGPAVDWTDRGQIDKLGEKTCVPVACYKNVLVIAESSAAEPDANQLKYHASGVGNVRVGWRGEGEKTKEVLELIEFNQLTPEQLAEAHSKALELDKSGMANSKEVYALTSPLEPIPN